jgi:hypothetical protein
MPKFATILILAAAANAAPQFLFPFLNVFPNSGTSKSAPKVNATAPDVPQVPKASAAPKPKVPTLKLPAINDIFETDVQKGVCRPVTLIHARGTSEIGNMGSTVGPSLATALRKALGNETLAVQGVPYPATILTATSGSNDPKDAIGAKTMALLVNQAVKNCSSTKIVLSGYSQGAEQVHGALQNLQDAKSIAVSLSNSTTTGTKS